jgi:hypothetical protein
MSAGLVELQQLNTELVRQQGKRTIGSQLIQLVGDDEMRAKKIPSPNMADAEVSALVRNR